MTDTAKLPKHVAGVRIPKPLRHAAEALLDAAATPEGRRAIAAALTAAAAALTTATQASLSRAESPAQALALLLVSPEMIRR